jgi:hypothetical protein
MVDTYFNERCYVRLTMGKKSKKMDKKSKKMSKEVKAIMHELGKPMETVINELPIKILLKLGRRVCFGDRAVRFYYDKQNPKFHLNREALRHAIRRSWAIGASQHREQIICILSDEGIINDMCCEVREKLRYRY